MRSTFRQQYCAQRTTVSKYNGNLFLGGIKTGCNVVSAYHVALCVKNFHRFRLALKVRPHRRLLILDDHTHT